MYTIIVTGGAGFIGSSFIRNALLSSDVHIVNIDSLTYASNPVCLKEFEHDPNYTFYHTDICNKSSVSSALRRHKPNCIVHFAAHTHVDRSIDSPRAFIDTNIVGTFTLLDMVRQLGFPPNFKFIHISTDEVYGSTTLLGSPFTENTKYDPSSPYSASKASADHLVRSYNRTYGIPTVITNCCNNYGPYQFPEKLIPLMIMNGIEGKKLPVYGSGSNVRDWIHVSDHISAIQCVINRGVSGETYNIGADCALSNLDVVHKICDALNKLSEIGGIPAGNYHNHLEFVKDRPGHDMIYRVCSKKIRSLGWVPSVKFDDGLNETVKWYYDNKDWVAQIHDRGRLGHA